MPCWYKYDTGTSLATTSEPCGPQLNGGIAQCCTVGDTCLSNGLCQYTYQDGGGSGYYFGGCTDPNFKDPACPANCSSFPNSDAVYSYTNEVWQCCGNGANGGTSRNCTYPAGSALTPVAPAPGALHYVAIVQSSSYIPLEPTPVPLNAAVSPGPSGTAAPQAGGLNGGAGVGIGLAAGLVGAALVWLLAFLIWRRKGYRLVKTPSYAYNHSQPFDGMGEEPQISMGYEDAQTRAIKAQQVAEVHGTAKRERVAEVPG